jgi:3-dehydroshikimate dehydratase
MKIVMHSYTFRTYPFEEAVRNAARFGWNGLELQPCHFEPDRIETELPARIKAAAEHNITIECVDFGGSFIADEAKVVEAAVRQMERTIDACASNGVYLLNGSVGSLFINPMDFGKNGSALAQDYHYERAAEAFRHLGPYAARQGVRIVFEVHMNTLHDTLASTARLLELVDCGNVMANPDPGNMFATSTAEKDPEALDLLAGRIGYFHFKNCMLHAGEYNYSVRLAEGQIDLYKWVQKLVRLGFDDRVCIEYCGAGDPRVAAQQDIDYLRKTLDWAQNP